MPTQQQIERFTLAFHKVAVQRLRDDPDLRRQAVEVLDRWESSGASPASRRYRDTWRQLLAGEVADLEQVVCADSEQAATLRSCSPLGSLVTEPERLRIRREAMAV